MWLIRDYVKISKKASIRVEFNVRETKIRFHLVQQSSKYGKEKVTFDAFCKSWSDFVLIGVLKYLGRLGASGSAESSPSFDSTVGCKINICGQYVATKISHNYL